VGLGARHHLGAAHTRVPQRNRLQDLEGPGGRGEIRSGTLSAVATDEFPNLPEKLTFLHAEDILDMYPDLPRKQRETMVLQKHPAIFIIGIGWPLKDGYPHEMRAADYDDW